MALIQSFSLLAHAPPISSPAATPTFSSYSKLSLLLLPLRIQLVSHPLIIALILISMTTK